jgi:nucleoid-associated protein YgaU
LSKIAERELGNASLFPSIASLNGISNPNLIFPGQVLKIPSTTSQNNGLSNLILFDTLFNK